MTSVEMKAELLAYWRYHRQCPVVGVEIWDQDVYTITKSRSIVWTEIKVSISDLRADASKPFHFKVAHLLGIPKEAKGHKEYRNQSKAIYAGYNFLPNQFYFAVPLEIADKALEVIEQRYPYAGLLVVRHHPELAFWGDHVSIRKQAPVLHKGKATIKTISVVVKKLTGSLASAYKAVVKAKVQEIPSEPEPNAVS